jgi:gliding motility-associated-like protein
VRGSLRIFDRYGKLLVDLDPGSRGWNGEYTGAALPADDYWFTATLQDGRTFTSHFALRR